MSIKLKANTWAKAEKMVSIFRRHNANVGETDKQTRQTVAGGIKRGFLKQKKKVFTWAHFILVYAAEDRQAGAEGNKGRQRISLNDKQF